LICSYTPLTHGSLGDFWNIMCVLHINDISWYIYIFHINNCIHTACKLIYHYGRLQSLATKLLSQPNHWAWKLILLAFSTGSNEGTTWQYNLPANFARKDFPCCPSFLVSYAETTTDCTEISMCLALIINGGLLDVLYWMRWLIFEGLWGLRFSHEHIANDIPSDNCY
jgi:hypothetical protein